MPRFDLQESFLRAHTQKTRCAQDNEDAYTLYEAVRKAKADGCALGIEDPTENSDSNVNPDDDYATVVAKVNDREEKRERFAAAVRQAQKENRVKLWQCSVVPPDEMDEQDCSAEEKKDCDTDLVPFHPGWGNPDDQAFQTKDTDGLVSASSALAVWFELG